MDRDHFAARLANVFVLQLLQTSFTKKIQAAQPTNPLVERLAAKMPEDRPARNGKRDCGREASFRNRRTFLIDTKLCWINIELAKGSPGWQRASVGPGSYLSNRKTALIVAVAIIVGIWLWLWLDLSIVTLHLK